MIKKILCFLKYPFLILSVIAVVISCEKDFKNIGTDLVNDNIYSSNKYNAQVRGYSIRIPSNITNGMGNYLLGYNENAQFGTLTASIATQLTLPETNPNWGENAVIDSVVITIPFLSKLIGNISVTNPNDTTKTILVPNYELNSVYTSGANNFNLNVYELGTFLNPLDPTDPTKVNEFFSDQVYLKTGSPLYTGAISPNKNDTMMVINRHKYTNDQWNTIEFYKKDTIKLEKAKPALRIPLDKQKIKQLFKDNDIANGFNFSSQDNFNRYFKGLYFEASNSGNGAALAYYDMLSAYMTIFYTESTVDTTTNTIKGEAKSFQYSFTGITTNVYDRDRTGFLVENYLINPNVTNGDNKLFVQGAAGSDAMIHLFGNDTNTDGIPDELSTLRDNNWLITDAKLYLYVDPSNTTSQYPEQLYIYKIENNEKYQTYDVKKFGYEMVGGDLVYDTDSIPDYYLFHLTDYVSEILKQNEKVKVVDFGIKVYDPQDGFDFLKPNDTIIKEYNRNFKGVVLTGKNPTLTPRDLKFEIHYSQKNN